MDRLLFLIAFTPDIERMKTYYRYGLGLDITSESPFFVSFGTGGASLALMAMHPSQKREFELCFETADIEADVRALRGRGVTFFDEIRDLEFGRVVHARDPEGSLLSLLQPSTRPVEGDGTPIGSVIINSRDVSGTKAYYRDRVGLPLVMDSPWWVEFDTGRTHLALHPRVERPGAEQHHGQPITFGFASSDLDEWVEELRQRGVPIVSEPADRGFGRFADIRDPDGNQITLRDAPAPPTLEEKLAEEYESDDAPRQASFRRPVNKNSKAVSRLVVKPSYTGAKKKTGKKPAMKAAAGARKPHSVRGAGPDHTRLKPKKARDLTRARARQATGHQKEAERRTIASSRRAAASASKGRPVKRAVARAARGRAAREGAARKGRGR